MLAMIALLGNDTPFPPLTQALHSPNGLLAAGGSLSATRLLDAYRHGIFPWFNAGEPVLWWSPDPRMVLLPDKFNISKSLHKTIQRKNYTLRTNYAFEQVMRACAEPRGEQAGTWIHEDMITAYTELHRMGIAHSVEIWMNEQPADEPYLAGGLYGVSIGRMFFGESMFSRVTDASKIALAHLAAQLQRWNYGLIDCQMSTPHLASLGAQEMPRTEFILRLQELIHYPQAVSIWQFDPEILI